jgi:FKBP-type peptidyl-prolyl cis-trans isomerase
MENIMDRYKTGPFQNAIFWSGFPPYLKRCLMKKRTIEAPAKLQFCRSNRLKMYVLQPVNQRFVGGNPQEPAHGNAGPLQPGFARGFVVFLCLVTLTASLHARGQIEDPAKALGTADTSYAFGLVLGRDLKQLGIEFDYIAFVEGFRAVIEGDEPRYGFDEALEKVRTAFTEAAIRQSEENREKEALFLKENGEREEVQTTASGLQYEVLKGGEGKKPGPQALVQVNYEGKLVNGTVFDSTWQRGEPASFPLDRVIPGWAEGIQLMSLGDVYVFYIPSQLAYGERGAGEMIPPNSPLIFRVELIEILEEGPEGSMPPGSAPSTP